MRRLLPAALACLAVSIVSAQAQNAAEFYKGRLGSTAHGPSGAFNTLGGRSGGKDPGYTMTGGGFGGKDKGKKKNRKGGKGKKGRSGRR